MRSGIGNGDIAPFILNVVLDERFVSFTLQPVCHLEICHRYPVRWRLFLLFKLYGHFKYEINFFSLPGFEVGFLGYLSRILVTVPI
jgi:hypothetical protein